MILQWEAEQVKVLAAVDGDTIDVELDMGFYVQTLQRLRIKGVDTPERGQPGYNEAKAFVAEKTLAGRVRLITYRGDKYGRFLVDVFYYDSGLGQWRSVAEELIARGLGKFYDGGAKG